MRIHVALLLLSTVAIAASSKEGGGDLQIYSPIGKRDPFKPPSVAVEREVSSISPLERFSLEQLQLRAILKGLGKSRAMFEDTEGNTHIVSEGEIIGRERGTVSRILNKEVIITERTFNYLGEENLFEKVLSLPVDEGENRGFNTVGDVPSSPSVGAGPGGSAPEGLPSSRKILSTAENQASGRTPETVSSSAPANSTRVPGAAVGVSPLTIQPGVPFVGTVPNSAALPATSQP